MRLRGRVRRMARLKARRATCRVCQGHGPWTIELRMDGKVVGEPGPVRRCPACGAPPGGPRITVPLNIARRGRRMP